MLLQLNIEKYIHFLNRLEIKIINKKLLIFDFDGTIVDSSPIHQKSFQEALIDYNVIVDYEEIKGMRTRDAILKIFNQSNVSISDKHLSNLVLKKQSLSQKYFSSISLMKDFEQFYIHAKSTYKLSIVSSASRTSIDIALKKFNLEGGFDLILSSESVDNAKPHP